MRLRGILTKDEEGALCLKMHLTPQNPIAESIPLEELLEEMMEKNVLIDIFPLTNRAKGADNE